GAPKIGLVAGKKGSGGGPLPVAGNPLWASVSSGRRCAGPLLMWWTVPAPGIQPHRYAQALTFASRAIQEDLVKGRRRHFQTKCRSHLRVLKTAVYRRSQLFIPVSRIVVS